MITFSQLGRWGRLGNQMYEYAALLGIGAELGYTVKIPPLSRHLLAACFRITTPVYRRHELWRVRRVFEEPCIGYSARYRAIRDNTDLRGFFQSPRYFPPREVVRREFTFHPRHLAAAETLLRPLRDQGRAVAGVMVRRGDYQLSPQQFVQLWSTGYYDNALAVVDQFDPVYVVSSDDPAWCRQRFVGERFRFADGIDDYAQLALLARCDHLIIANSSYAWWAAWLNESPGLRIAPARWWGDDCDFPESDRDPLPDGWLAVGWDG